MLKLRKIDWFHFRSQNLLSLRKMTSCSYSSLLENDSTSFRWKNPGDFQCIVLKDCTRDYATRWEKKKPREAKLSIIVKQRCVVYHFVCDLCDTDYVGYV